MKKLVGSKALAFALLTVLASGCAPAAATVSPTSTASPIPPTSTSEPTATPFPSTPTATLMTLAVQCSIEDKVSTEKDCRLLTEAIEIGRHYLLNNFGKDATGGLRIRLYSAPGDITGGYYGEGHNYGLSDADPSNVLMQINTGHPFWADYGGDEYLYRRQKGAIHEFTHYWQLQHGCMKSTNDPLLDFLIQGHAEYVANMATGRPEDINAGQAVVMWSHLKFNEQLWFDASDVASVAFKALMEGYPPEHFTTYCDLMTQGSAPRKAFENVFGQSIQDFRASFKEKSLGILKDCTQATCGASYGKDDPRYGSLTPLIDYSLSSPNLTIKITDQSGNPVPDVNLQLFRVLYNGLSIGTGGEDAGTDSNGVLSAPVLPGTYMMRFCEPGYKVRMYSMDTAKCVYELNYFEVVPGETKTINFQFWDIQDHDLDEPNFVFTLLAVDGTPLANQYVKICGYDPLSSVCLNSQTGEDGVFRVGLRPGNYLLRLVQPGQGEMGVRGNTDPRYGMNLSFGEAEYEIRDIRIEPGLITTISYQFPIPNLQIRFLDVNGSPLPNIYFHLCKYPGEAQSAQSQEGAAERETTDTILSRLYTNWNAKQIRVGSLDGICFLLSDHTDKRGNFSLHVEPGKYFIYFDDPGSHVHNYYFDHVLSDIVVTSSDTTVASYQFK